MFARKTSRVLLAGVVALSMTVAACGSSGSSDNDSGNTNSGNTNQSQAPDGNSSESPEESGSTGGETDGGAEGRDTLVIGYDSTLHSPDMARYTGLLEIYATAQVFDYMTFRDHDGGTVPMIATKWENSEDQLTWTVDIRTDVKFHDGTPLTAEDVAFSMMRLADPDFGQSIAGYWQTVTSADVVDEDTVAFHLSAPLGIFMEQGTRLPIVPKAYYEKVGAEEFSKAPIGSGPYKFESFTPEGDFVVTANKDYWGGAPSINKVILRPLQEESQRTAALLAGQIDIASNLNIDQIDQVKNNPNLEVRTSTGVQRMVLNIDTTKPPFDDVRVRQALNYAVDKQAIVDNLLGGFAEVTAGITTPAEAGFNDELEPYAYDPDKAKQLLAEAGYPDGFETSLAVDTAYPKASEIMQAVASFFGDVGIKTNLREYDSASYNDASSNHTIDPLSYHGWGGGGQFLATHYFFRVTPCAGNPVLSQDSTWGGYYCNEELDENVVKTLNDWAVDHDGAVAAIKKAQQIYHDDAGAVFLFATTVVYGVNKNLDWTPRSDQVLWMIEASWK